MARGRRTLRRYNNRRGSSRWARREGSTATFFLRLNLFIGSRQASARTGEGRVGRERGSKSVRMKDINWVHIGVEFCGSFALEFVSAAVRYQPLARTAPLRGGQGIAVRPESQGAFGNERVCALETDLICHGPAGRHGELLHRKPAIRVAWNRAGPRHYNIL